MKIAIESIFCELVSALGFVVAVMLPALLLLRIFTWSELAGRLHKMKLCKMVSTTTPISPETKYILKRFGSIKRSTVTTKELYYHYEQSLRAHVSFAQLGCRGFSYYLSPRMKGFPARDNTRSSTTSGMAIRSNSYNT